MRFHPFNAGLLLACLATAPLARADSVWCVNNTTSFEQALESAHDDDTTIKLVRGHYQTFGIEGGTYAHGLDHDLTILGGYADATCSEAGRSLDPALTVFEPFSPGGAFAFDISMDGNLLLKSVTLRGYGHGVYLQHTGDAFSFDDAWKLDRVRVEASGGLQRPGWSAPSSPIMVWSFFDADVTLSQVAVVGNPTTECAAEMRTADQSLTVVQSTFAHNGGTGLCVHGEAGQGAPVDIDNNIFWGGGCGLQVFNLPGSALHVRHNTLDCTGYDALPSIDIGNDALDPQFADAAGGDYRLLATSPAIDAGLNPPTGGLPGSDMTGGPRVIGANVDRGPWEADVSSASVLMVTNANASGSGSLAAALEQSNTIPGLQVIRFNIPGGCPRLITQVSGQPLPEITDSVRIEGYSQPGSVRGAPPERTLCVGVGGNGQLSKLLAIALGSPANLDVSGMGFGATALVSGAAAVTLLSGSGHVVAGNQFGGSIGPAANPASLGALQTGVLAGFGAGNSTIGGLDADQGNVFNEATSAAVDIGASSVEPANFRVYGNYVGIRANGLGALANGNGIVVNNARGNWIWNNWIGGNSIDGLVLKGNADRNFILANEIGRCPGCITPPLGSEPLIGNGSHGILVQAGADDNVLNGNRIAGNGFGYAEEHAANRNALVYNRIYRNAGLGIDIGRDGVTPNDNGGASPDGVQNFPILASAGGGFYNGSVRGGLNAPAENEYAIEIYASDECDASGHGEGQRLVGQGRVTTPAAPLPGFHSSASFEIAVSAGSLDGKAITAIARSENGSTSEFSPCRAYLYSDLIFADGFEAMLP